MAKNPSLFAALEFGPSILRTAIFERRNGSAIPFVGKKTIHEFPPDASPARRVARLRELLFGLVKEMKQAPELIAVSLAPPLGVYAMEDWGMKLPANAARTSPADLNRYFQNLFLQHQDSGAARIAYSLGIFVNGYPVAPEKDKLLLFPPAAELSFHTLVFRFDSEAGAGLAEIKKGLGGMPMVFVPAPVALETAVRQGLGVSDALFLLDDEREATLLWIKAGSLAQAAAFSYNGIGEALNNFYLLGPLPRTLFLGGAGAGKEDFRAKLKSGGWMKEFSYLEAPDIRVAEGPSFFGGDSLGGTLRGPEEIVLGALIYWTLYHHNISP